MQTRAAIKLEDAAIAAAPSTYSSPPATPTKLSSSLATSSPPLTPVNNELSHHDLTDNSIVINLPPSLSSVGKHVPIKTEVKSEPVTGGWDVLPHGLGKKGDLLDYGSEPLRKKVKTEKNEEDVKIEGISDSLTKSKSPFESNEALQEAAPENLPPVKTVSSVKGKGKKAAPKDKKLTLKGKKAIPKSVRVKKNEYGLTPGMSPYPDYAKPSREDCEEINRLLSELHGVVDRPAEIPAPSMNVAGCGEVPDLLDALMRTLLSASTQAKNANMALAGLKETFGLRTAGRGIGSVNWEKVHQATQPEVMEAIKRGGLAARKSNYIKSLLNIVYTQNSVRLSGLHSKRAAGKEPLSREEETLFTQLSETLLSMDYVFEMSSDDAMLEMSKLPGIGVKTSSCVILFCMKRPSFAVDTHVWRLCKWLGWVPATDSNGKVPSRNKTFSHCEVRIPDELKYSLHQLFIRHGKTCGRCKAGTSAGTAEWNKTVCPIESFVDRADERKSGAGAAKKTKGAQAGKKRKRSEESEEDDENESEEAAWVDDGAED